MVTKIFSWSALAALAFVAIPAGAKQHTPIVEHWNAETHLRLAQCFIAEADENLDDWTAIAYTLNEWLEVRRKRWPELRFVDVAKGVCSVHKLSPNKRTKRQRWIRDLGFPVAGTEPGSWSLEKPVDFPRTASWKRKQRYWLKALTHAQEWNRRQHRNPCKGAVIWGAPRDPDDRWHLKTDDPILKGRKVVRLKCSDSLSNDYYRLMTRKEREEFDLRLGADDTKLPVRRDGLRRDTDVHATLET